MSPDRRDKTHSVRPIAPIQGTEESLEYAGLSTPPPPNPQNARPFLLTACPKRGITQTVETPFPYGTALLTLIAAVLNSLSFQIVCEVYDNVCVYLHGRVCD